MKSELKSSQKKRVCFHFAHVMSWKVFGMLGSPICLKPVTLLGLEKEILDWTEHTDDAAGAVWRRIVLLPSVFGPQWGLTGHNRPVEFCISVKVKNGHKD